MDSITHLALGSAIGIVAMRGRTAPWKAALVGAACNTLPDLDIFLNHGDAVSNVTMHRGDSHALFWLTLISPAVALAAAALFRDLAQYRRWWLMVWLALIAHPLLDAFTVYGTQIARPFIDSSYGLGSIFIIDPLYTLPLIIGVVVALSLRNAKRLALGARRSRSLHALSRPWACSLQDHVTRLAQDALRAAGHPGGPPAGDADPFQLYPVADRGGDAGSLSRRLPLATRSRSQYRIRFLSARRTTL